MKEKPLGDGGWINGGFFVLSPKVLDLIEDDQTIWEAWPMQTLAAQDQLQGLPAHGILAADGYVA